MIIREAKAEDIPTLSELARKTYTETFGHSMTPEQLAAELDAKRSEKYFLSILNTDTILVAEKANRLAGYIQLCTAKLNVEGLQLSPLDQAINAIYVHSDFQGQRVGQALMDAAFSYPKFQKAETIYIDVWDENKRAINFYISYGFKIVGRYDVIIDGQCIGQDLVLTRPSHNA